MYTKSSSWKTWRNISDLKITYSCWNHSIRGLSLNRWDNLNKIWIIVFVTVYFTYNRYAVNAKIYICEWIWRFLWLRINDLQKKRHSILHQTENLQYCWFLLKNLVGLYIRSVSAGGAGKFYLYWNQTLVSKQGLTMKSQCKKSKCRINRSIENSIRGKFKVILVYRLPAQCSWSYYFRSVQALRFMLQDRK